MYVINCDPLLYIYSPGIVESKVVSSGFNDASTGLESKAKGTGPVKFYCDTDIFSNIYFEGSGFHQMLDQSIQKAIAATVYLGKLEQTFRKLIKYIFYILFYC